MRITAPSLLFLTIAMVPVTGCYTIRRRVLGPDLAPIVASGNDLDLLKARINCDRLATIGGNGSGTIDCAYGAKTITVPRTLTIEERNSVQELLLGAADRRFELTKEHIGEINNSLTFSAEVTGVTLSAVAAILGDTEMKTILSTTSSLVQSTNTAIKKDFLANKTNSALVNQMDATRATVAKDIVVGQKKTVAEYGFETALRDALRYDQAGSVHDALIDLDTTAGNEKKDAETALTEEKMK